LSTEAATPAATLERHTEFSFSGNVARLLCIAVPVAIWFSPLPIESTTKHGLAVTAFMILAWITEVMDHALAGLIGCYLYWALKVVP
jgi:di/tricarboxylate transporter